MKSIKLFTILTLSLGILIFNSCKKDKKTNTTATSNFYITADVNGIATTFNINESAATITINGGQVITNIGGQAKDGTILAISLVGGTLAGKTYSDAAVNDDDRPSIVINAGNDPFVNDDHSANIPTVTISSLSSNTISGTFSGGLVYGSSVGSIGPSIKLITNGKFNLKFSPLSM